MALRALHPRALPLPPAGLLLAGLLASTASLAEVTLRWPAFPQAAEIRVEGGSDPASLVPVAQLPGAATRFVDATPPEGPRACYRVRALDAEGNAIDELSRCLSRPPASPPAVRGAAVPPGDAAPELPAVGSGPAEDGLPGQAPRRWRGLEGWYQALPAPTGPSASEAP